MGFIPRKSREGIDHHHEDERPAGMVNRPTEAKELGKGKALPLFFYKKPNKRRKSFGQFVLVMHNRTIQKAQKKIKTLTVKALLDCGYPRLKDYI